MTYNTGNPIGSTDARDLYDNAQNLDQFTNSAADTELDRLGVSRQTLQGIRNASQYQFVGAYAAGIELTSYNQTVSYSGEFYAPGPGLTLPYTTTGSGAAEIAMFRGVGDAALRSDLLGDGGSLLIGRNAGTLEQSLVSTEYDVLAIKSAGFLQNQEDAVSVLAGGTIGDVSAFTTAIASGTVRIALAGDSILEGLSQITHEDSPAGLLLSSIRAQNPGTTFVVGNFSLSGRGIGNLASYSYSGTVAPDTPVNGFYQLAGDPEYGLWPTGSTIGKSWIYHVRDFAPDLFVLAMGMNEASGDTRAIAALTKQVISEARTWAVAPSVAIVTSMLPSTITPPFAGAPELVQLAADALRGVAYETNSTLLDANRMYNLAVSAQDVVDKKHASRGGFTGFPAGWTVTGGSFSSSEISLSGSGDARLNYEFTDGSIRSSFVLPDYAAGTPVLRYRHDPSYADGQQYQVVYAGGTTLILYAGGSAIASGPVSIANGSTLEIKVVVKGAHHKVYANRVLIIDVWNYEFLRKGKLSVGISGSSGTITKFSSSLGRTAAYGIPRFTEADMLGINDWLSNPDSLGGGAVNHPSKLGALVAYGSAWEPLLGAARGVSPAHIVRAETTNTALPFDSPINQTIIPYIDGVAGPMGLAVGAVGNASAYASYSAKVNGGRTVRFLVDVSAIGGSMATDLDLPKGRWDAQLVISLARNATGYRNKLTVTATRCI